MQTFIHNKDVFTVTEADSLVLPVDGSGPNLVGNLAQQFMKRIGVDQLDGMLAPPPHSSYDGEPVWSAIGGLFDTHFDYICCIDSLSHADGADHRAMLRKTFNLMFDGMACGGVGKSVACTILTGGSRIPPVDALYIMLEIIEKWRHLGYEVHIAELDPERFELLQRMVR